jgi:nucleotide-binding universal stress UspA family protein
MVRLNHIVVATDFSAPSETALNYGRELARTFGATLHVVHVTDNVIARLGPEYYPVAVPDLQKELEDAAWRRLDALLTAEDREQLHAKPVVLTSAAGALAIVDYARDAAIDLIVMGTHGRGGMSRLIMGSVAERVVRMAPCPVLTVHHPEHEFIAPDALIAVAKTN